MLSLHDALPIWNIQKASLARLRVRNCSVNSPLSAPLPGRLRRIARAALMVSWENGRSEEHTSELQSLMRISYAVFCLKKKHKKIKCNKHQHTHKKHTHNK